MKTKSKQTEVLAPNCYRIHPTLREYFGYCFYKVAMRMRANVDERLSEFGVIAPQFGVLTMLKFVGPMTQVELGKFMAIDKATMVRLLDGLEEKKYLARVSQAGDRRAKVLQITKAGEKIQTKINEVRLQVEEEFFSPLTAKERSALKEALAKLSV